MNWDNKGNEKGKWVIDHTIPLASFNLEDDAQMKKACHYTNLIPMWWEENASKSDKEYVFTTEGVFLV